MLQRFLFIAAAILCTSQVQANDLANVTYTGTANNVSLAARIVPAQEAIKKYGYDIHALNITPVSFVLTNHGTTDVLVSKNAINIYGSIDANDAVRNIFIKSFPDFEKNVATWFCLAATGAIGAGTAEFLGYGRYKDYFHGGTLIAAPFLMSAPIYKAYNISQAIKRFGMTESVVLKPLEKLYVTAFIDNARAGYRAQMPVNVTLNDPSHKRATAIFDFELPNYYFLAK